MLAGVKVVDKAAAEAALREEVKASKKEKKALKKVRGWPLSAQVKARSVRPLVRTVWHTQLLQIMRQRCPHACCIMYSHCEGEMYRGLASEL